MKTVILALLLTAASQASAQTRTKIGDLYLGETFDEAFPKSYQSKFQAYLLSDGGGGINDFGRMCRGQQDGEVIYDDDPDDNTHLMKKLVFHDRRLVEVHYEFGSGTTFQSQLHFLTSKYGKPTAAGTDVVQNGFGARWNEHKASWVLPNGDSIIAGQVANNSNVGVIVIFIAKGQLKVVTPKNPY